MELQDLKRKLTEISLSSARSKALLQQLRRVTPAARHRASHRHLPAAVARPHRAGVAHRAWQRVHDLKARVRAPAPAS